MACLVLLCPQSFLGGLFGAVCEIDVLLNDAENRKTAELKTEDGKVEKHYMFYDGESVSGKVSRVLSIQKIVWHIVSDMFFVTVGRYFCVLLCSKVYSSFYMGQTVKRLMLVSYLLCLIILAKRMNASE